MLCSMRACHANSRCAMKSVCCLIWCFPCFGCFIVFRPLKTLTGQLIKQKMKANQLIVWQPKWIATGKIERSLEKKGAFPFSNIMYLFHRSVKSDTGITCWARAEGGVGRVRSPHRTPPPPDWPTWVRELPKTWTELPLALSISSARIGFLMLWNRGWDQTAHRHLWGQLN